MDHFKEVHVEKFILLFNLLLWDVTNSICIKGNPNFMIFRFIYCVKFFWAHFFTVLGIFTYFNIAKKPYLKNLSHIQNINIFSKHNF